MLVHIRPYAHPRSQKVKQFFTEVVMLHINFKGRKYRASCKHIFCPYNLPQPLGWGQKVKHFYLIYAFMFHVCFAMLSCLFLTAWDHLWIKG